MPEERDVPRDPRQYLPGGPPQFKARSALATFSSREEAVRARQALQQAGFNEAQVDEVAWRSSDTGDLTDQPFPKTLTGRAGDETNRATAAMDPAVSGFADGYGPVTGEHRFLLTVPVNSDSSMDKAVEIIRRYGGNLDSGGPS